MDKNFDSILFGFLQAIAFGEVEGENSPDFEATRPEIGNFKTLRAETVLRWPTEQRIALKELLNQWLIVLNIPNEDGTPMLIPSKWIDGYSSTRLNEHIVDEIQYRFDALEGLYRRSQKALQDREAGSH